MSMIWNISVYLHVNYENRSELLMNETYRIRYVQRRDNHANESYAIAMNHDNKWHWKLFIVKTKDTHALFKFKFADIAEDPSRGGGRGMTSKLAHWQWI